MGKGYYVVLEVLPDELLLARHMLESKPSPRHLCVCFRQLFAFVVHVCM